MKQFIFLVIIATAFLSGFSQEQVKDFDQLMEALKNGNTISLVIHYGKCQLISDNEIAEKVPDAIGGMNIDVYEYFAAGAVRNKKAFVVSSNSKLIQNPIGEGFVYNYVKFKAYEDGEIKITAKYLDPQTMEENMTENFFTTINDGNNEGAVYLYSK